MSDQGGHFVNHIIRELTSHYAVALLHVVVKKTSPKGNQGIKGVNLPLHECVRIDTLYITRNRMADVNILGIRYLIIKKSMHISVRRDRE